MMKNIKKNAHQYLINKGVRTMADKFSAITIETMLTEFAEIQLKNLNISVVSNLLITFMEELTTKDIELIKQYKYEEVINNLKSNL